MSTLLMVATYGMEVVECGGAIAKHVRAGGDAAAVVAFARPESRPQVKAASDVLGISSVEFLGLDFGDLPPGAEAKQIFVEIIRRHRPSILICQDPVHAYEDLDPGRRDIMTIYIESIALAGRDWRIEECGGHPTHTVDAVYFMTPSEPNCLVDVADVWGLKEQAMHMLESQMAFSAAGYKRRFTPEVLEVLAPGADQDGDQVALGKAVHREVDRAYHISQAIHSHSRLALAEPYRKMGLFTFDTLPE